MSKIKAFYRSEHPSVRAYHEEIKTRYAAYAVARDRFLADFPAGTEALIQCGWRGSFVMTGVACETQPGPLWVNAGSHDYWKISRKTSAGKKLGKAMDAIRFEMPELPGMPAFIFVDLMCCSAGSDFLSEVCWAHWACDCAEVERRPSFDPAIWTRAKASEYYLAKEAAEATTGAAA